MYSETESLPVERLHTTPDRTWLWLWLGWALCGLMLLLACTHVAPRPMPVREGWEVLAFDGTRYWVHTIDF